MAIWFQSIPGTQLQTTTRKNAANSISGKLQNSMIPASEKLRIMKTIFYISVILLSCLSCTKEQPEYITHDSEIFINDDTLFFGEWKYLYTWSGGGITGISQKTAENLPSINVKNKDDYENTLDGVVLSRGKIDTAGYKYGKLLIVFCPDGIRSPDIIPNTINIVSKDTLILGLGIYGDWYRDDYYKRIK